MALDAGARLGPYQIVALIGAGGMGEVYRARDMRLERTVAIKVLPAQFAADPKFRERFDREAKALSSLNHPYICTLYDVGHHNGTDFLVMEHLEGETLANRIDKGRPLPVVDALRYAVEIADALATAHHAGIVHRDLKPANVFLARTGSSSGPLVAKLLDFGLVKAVRPAVAGAGLSKLPTTPPNLTAQGTILGTFQYMAPEQVEGQEADTRSDIFAFGVVVYEMLTGKPVFAGKTHASLISAILKDEPPPLSTFQPLTPVLLDHVVSRCLAKDPEARWQSAADVLCELKWVTEAPSPSIESRQKKRTITPERVAWASIAGLAVAAAVTFGMLYLRRAPEPGTHTVRFNVPPPPNASQIPTGQGSSMVAVSPDGRRLAFVAVGETNLLWVRSFDAIDAQPLAGTNGAVFPFWSPDSRTLGFVAGGALKTVDAAGGPVQSITQAIGVRGGAWSLAGTIVLGFNSGGLFKLSANGGQPVALTQLNAARGETSHRFPAFLPDGKHLVYSATPSNAVWLTSLDSGEPSQLLTADSQAQYAGSGHLVFMRQGTLMAQPFDWHRVTLTGEAVPIAQQVVRDGTNSGAFSVSADGVLAYRSVADDPTTQLTWFERGGRRTAAVEATGQYRNPALSPDGSRVAVEVFDPQSRTQDVWVIDLVRGIPSRFTFDSGNDIYPIWSPDGKWIMFASDRGGVFNLYRKLANGAGTEELVLKSASDKRPNSWTSDGRAVVYLMQGKRSLQLGILPTVGDRTPRVFEETQFSEGEGLVSPDGRWVAHNSTESGRFEIYVQSFPTPGGGKWQVSKDGSGNLQWRRDGKELFYYSFAGRLMAVPILSSMPFEFGTAVPLFDVQMLGGPSPSLGYRMQWDVAPDGRFLVNVLVKDTTASPPISVVVNWQAALGARERR